MADGLFTCTIVSPDEGDERFSVRPDEPVLFAMIRQSVAGLDVGCRGGGCGVCRVKVLGGPYATLRMSKRHVTDDERAEGYALACRLLVKGDLMVRAAPRAKTPAPLLPGGNPP